MSDQNEPSENWAAIVYVKGPQNQTVLVLDRGKPMPHFWKLAGGRKEPIDCDIPAKTAQRELKEETGIDVDYRDLELIERVSKWNHDLYVYSVTVMNFNGILKIGDEGEKVAIFEKHELEKMVDFFPPHWGYLKKLEVVTTA